jgi:bacterioferritin-associated ferredoxin
MYVCICKAVSDHDIRRAVADGARCCDEVLARPGGAPCGGCCYPRARNVFAGSLDAVQPALPVAA